MMLSLVTTAGINYMAADFLSGSSARINAFNYIDCGTGTTAAVIGDTALGTAAGTARVSGTQSDPTAGQYRSVGTVAFTSTLAITEFGIFSASTLVAAADNDAKAPLRFVINESMAKSLFPGEDPIGRKIVVLMRAENPPGEIVGVTGDIKHAGLDAKIRPTVYYPQAHLFFNFGTLVVRANGDPAALSRPVANLIHELDPELAISEMGTMRSWIDNSVTRPRFQARLVAGFAALALLLAVIGIYGVVSYGVTQRTHEIGVRMALGAQRSDVARMILRRGARLAVIGLVIGTVGALVLGRYLETLLFEVKPADPATLTAMAALLLGVALAASYVSARRAAKMDPLTSLRYE
ncbi:MAG: FtsX-like permease family protein [Bryobacteraceae bacterium]